MSTEPRNDGRAPDDLREINFVTGFVRTATGSALIEAGGTRVICTASVDEDVPRWMAGQGRGWVTAEYGMLPASTGERKRRDVSQGPPRRAHGRDPAPDRPLAARRDRLQGARRAHRLDRLRRARGRRRHPLRRDHRRLRRARAGACAGLIAEGKLTALPLTQSVAAVSCGIVGGRALLDLDYSEDSTAEVDANVVMTGDGGLVEVQATAERTPLSRASLDELLALAASGIERLRAAQQEAVGAATV